MSTLPGPGPVFEFEWLTRSRRWPFYAMRVLFVGSLLIALSLAWRSSAGRGLTAAQAYAAMAMDAYYAIVGTQLTLVLVVAPAATAGSICVEKARGTLAHMLVTDLTGAEIVLGKLAARLAPVLMMVGCTLPVAALCTLLGGIDPDALAGAYAVTVGVAVLGCSLALTLSIWAKKTHEVLTATYLILVLWLLADPIARRVSWIFGGGAFIPAWIADVTPFDLAFATYNRPAALVGPAEYAAFLAGCLAASAVLLLVAVRRVRAVAAREAGRPSRRKPSRWAWMRRGEAKWEGLVGRLPGPSLDGNPVLWREWRRNRPSGWMQRVWSLYIGGAIVFTVIAISLDAGGGPRSRTALWVNGFQVAIGLLLLSVGASTSLAEERARGSLDILMATPMSTREIVWGKWLGAFRGVPWLAALPVLLASCLAWQSRHWADVILLVAAILAYGSFITSLGLALATWVPRLGRAVALGVFAYVVVTVGSFFLILGVLARSPQGERMLAFSPFGGPAVMTAEAAGDGPPRNNAWIASWDPWDFLTAYGWESLAILTYAIAAVALLLATLRTFDRCLGRAAPRSSLPSPTPPGRPRIAVGEGGG